MVKTLAVAFHVADAASLIMKQVSSGPNNIFSAYRKAGRTEEAFTTLWAQVMTLCRQEHEHRQKYDGLPFLTETDLYRQEGGERKYREAPPGWAEACLTEKERNQARTKAVQNARRAAGVPEVEAFRHEFLSGRLLPVERIGTFVFSAAAGLLTGAQFRALGVDLTGYSEEFISREPDVLDDGRVNTTLRLSPPEQVVTANHRPTDAMEFWPGLTFYVGNEPYQPDVCFYPGTVLDALHRACSRLREAFGWGMAEAYFFVLGGKAPTFNPVEVLRQVAFVNDDSIGLPTVGVRYYVMPWVSPASVARVHQKLRQEIKRMSPPQQLHPLDTKTPHLVNFVQEREAERGKPAETWTNAEKRACFNEWNLGAPQLAEAHVGREEEWTYTTTGRLFEAFKRGRSKQKDPAIFGATTDRR